MQHGTELSNYSSGKCVQYIAVNVDDIIKTHDGHITFRGVGIIAAITPGSQTSKHVPRISLSSDDLTAIDRIDIIYFQADEFHHQSSAIQISPTNDDGRPTELVDILWKMSLPIHFLHPG